MRFDPWHPEFIAKLDQLQPGQVEEPVWKPTYIIRGLRSLRVTG